MSAALSESAVSGSDEWIIMYRGGITGAGIARVCEAEDILEILRALANAKRDDPLLEAEHRKNLLRHARNVEEDLAAERVFTPLWRTRIAELTVFVETHGRMPRQAGGDLAETALGRWLHTQRGKVGKGTLDPRQRAALDAVGMWDSDRRNKRNETRLPARLQALVEFRARHRRWPTYRNRTDPDECALGTWLYTARQAARDGRLPDSARQALDNAAPGWNG